MRLTNTLFALFVLTISGLITSCETSSPAQSNKPSSSQSPSPPEQSYSARISSMWVESTGYPLYFYIEVTDLNRQQRILRSETKAKLALIWLNPRTLLDEKVIVWQQNSPAIQGANFEFRDYGIPSTAAMWQEYINLQKSKDKAYAVAKAQAEQDFLAGKSYIVVKQDDYRVTDEESIRIASKYVTVIVAPYIE